MRKNIRRPWGSNYINVINMNYSERHARIYSCVFRGSRLGQNEGFWEYPVACKFADYDPLISGR